MRWQAVDAGHKGALDLQPDEQKAWLLPHKTMYLLGTEAPDNDEIRGACGAPNTGYDDRMKGHRVDWNDDHSDMVEERAAFRAAEEYDKAEDAFADGDSSAAAFDLGAMAHYIGDVSQYGHTCRCEARHGDYENWAKSRTASSSVGYLSPISN